jgi:hypothetical protein
MTAKTGGKKAKVGSAPKKPLTGYLLFLEQQRKMETTSIPLKELAARWQLLSDDKKLAFKQDAAKLVSKAA